MASTKRIRTKYPGVFYRESARIGGVGEERVYYIVFKKDGKVLEEKVGRQYADDMTPAKAAGIRAERIENRRASRKEIRAAAAAQKTAEAMRPTFGKLWDAYKAQNLHKKSLRNDISNFKNHLTYYADTMPCDLRTKDIDTLRNHLLEHGLRPQSVKLILGLLRELIHFGVRNGMCEMPNPAQLQFDMPKVDNLKTETMTPTQLTAYLRALDEEPDQHAAAFLRLALATGMRKGAIMALRWDDLDFQHGFITLRGDSAKKGKTERIPMSLGCRQIFQSIARTTSPYVFPGKDGGPRREFQRVARRVKRKAGLPDDFRPLHGLRHAYASFLASSGKVDLYTLQKLLTHSSPQMTQRYAHLADEALKRAANVADDIFITPEKEYNE